MYSVVPASADRPFTIRNCRFENNSAANSGGAIYHSVVNLNTSFNQFYLLLETSSFRANTARERGGALTLHQQEPSKPKNLVMGYSESDICEDTWAIYNDTYREFASASLQARIAASTFSDNHAPSGGAVAVSNGNVTMHSVSMSHNGHPTGSSEVTIGDILGPRVCCSCDRRQVTTGR